MIVFCTKPRFGSEKHRKLAEKLELCFLAFACSYQLPLGNRPSKKSSTLEQYRI
jgi:hypothetical protein